MLLPRPPELRFKDKIRVTEVAATRHSYKQHSIIIKVIIMMKRP